jgi:hypothetical protein
MDIKVLACEIDSYRTVVKTGYSAAHNVRIAWQELYVDDERALDSEVAGSTDKTMLYWEWAGVALVVGRRCNGECIEEIKEVAQNYAEYLNKEGYLTIELYDDDATFDAVTNLLKVLSLVSTSKSQFVFLFDGHGNSAPFIRLADDADLDPTDLNRALLSLRSDTTFIFILDACSSGRFINQFEELLADHHSKYILLSCGEDTQACFTEKIEGKIKSFSSYFLSKIESGYSVKTAFDKIEDAINSQNPQALVGDVEWENLYIKRPWWYVSWPA